MCTSSCALIWIGGETGRKFFYRDRPGVLTFLCFHQASQKTLRAPSGPMLPAPSGPGNAAISKYLADLGYKQDMIEWATAAAQPPASLPAILTPELAKKFNIDFWYNTEDGQHYTPAGEPRIASDHVGVSYAARSSGSRRSALTISTSRSLSQL